MTDGLDHSRWHESLKGRTGLVAERSLDSLYEKGGGHSGVGRNVLFTAKAG